MTPSRPSGRRAPRPRPSVTSCGQGRFRCPSPASATSSTRWYARCPHPRLYRGGDSGPHFHSQPRPHQCPPTFQNPTLNLSPAVPASPTSNVSRTHGTPHPCPQRQRWRHRDLLRRQPVRYQVERTVAITSPFDTANEDSAPQSVEIESLHFRNGGKGPDRAEAEGERFRIPYTRGWALVW